MFQMTQSSEGTIGKIIRWRWTLTILGASSTAIMLWNSLYEKSPVLGLSVSLVIFYIGSKAVASLFFRHERPFVKDVLGFAAFISVATLLGIGLLYGGVFIEAYSLFAVTGLVLALCIASALKGSKNRIATRQLKTDGDKNVVPLILVCSYIFLTAVAFYSLFLARTGEGAISVWLTIPNYFLLFFFLSSLDLVLILFFTRIPIGLKLLLVFINSFLSHSLFLIVWYPGRYGDPWSFLAEMRFIDREGAIFGYSHVLSNFLVVDFVKYQGLFSLALLFERMFSIDIYWVNFTLIPLLWSLLVPVFLYKLAESITVKISPSFLLLSAMGGSLFSTLVYWGAVAHANALGFIFLLFSVVLLLKWFVSGGRMFWGMSLVISVLTFLTHLQPGIFALVFLFGATVLKTRLAAILKWVSCSLLFLTYPFLLCLNGAALSLSGLFSLENFLSFLSQMATLLFALAFVGLVFSFKSAHVKRRGVALLFLFYVMVLTGYYVTSYGMTGLPFSPDRIIAIGDILLTPILALGLLTTADFLRSGFSKVKNHHFGNVHSRSFGMLLVCLFLSAQATLALYVAYPRNEITQVQPAWYEINAAYYLDSTPEKYVVLCEPGFANLAEAFLGSDYAYGSGHGTFGVPEWNWWVSQMSWEMENNPSLDILLNAMRRVGATVGYVVVSTRLPEGYKLQDIVERVSEVLPVDRIFGNGKLYVFKYSTQVVTGKGPSLKVTYDGGASEENVTTEFRSTFVSDVNYNLTLSGHSSYNITGYPAHWTFSALYVNQQLSTFDNVSDINNFVYISKLAPTDVVRVAWQANNLYPIAGWKDDSFRSGWHTNPYAHVSTMPTVLTDGNILEISWNFTPGNYYYYQSDKRVGISTDDFPYLFMKWRTTGPIAEVTVSFDENRTRQQVIVGYGSQSLSWTVTMVKLSPGENINSITVGITNYKDVTSVFGSQSLYVDYILICAKQ
jgi:hypothetical protein